MGQLGDASWAMGQLGDIAHYGNGPFRRAVNWASGHLGEVTFERWQTEWLDQGSHYNRVSEYKGLNVHVRGLENIKSDVFLTITVVF